MQSLYALSFDSSQAARTIELIRCLHQAGRIQVFIKQYYLVFIATVEGVTGLGIYMLVTHCVLHTTCFHRVIFDMIFLFFLLFDFLLDDVKRIENCD